MTPDWAARPTDVPYAVFGDPQSLNLYIYVRNDPVSQADADGHGATGDTCYENPVCKAEPALAQNTVTVARVDTIGTHANQDGTTTTVTQTTTATFSSASGREGEFLGATTQSTVTTTGTIGGGEPVTLSTASSNLTSISKADAVKAIGSRAFTDAQQSAVPSFATQFGRVTGQDARAHPGKYAFAAVEVLAIFTPLPEALAAIEGMHAVKASLNAGVAADDRTWALLQK